MSIIHASDSQVGIVAIHGFYPAYWVGIHHEWVQPFNYLVENDINTFFTNMIGMTAQVVLL